MKAFAVTSVGSFISLADTSERERVSVWVVCGKACKACKVCLRPVEKPRALGKKTFRQDS